MLHSKQAVRLPREEAPILLTSIAIEEEFDRAKGFNPEARELCRHLEPDSRSKPAR